MLSSKQNESVDEVAQCSETSTLKPLVYGRSKDLYRDLSESEIIKVRDYILNEASLNVTRREEATVNSNYIFLIELQNPDKYSAIAYLDGKGAKPGRAANVVIIKGAETPPKVEEILVHLKSPMKHEVNTILGTKPIPFNSRPQDKLEYEQLEILVKDFTKKVCKILYESYGGYTYHNCTDRCLTYADVGPGTVNESGERKMWVWFMRHVPGNYLHSIGLELLVQREGSDVSKWKIEKVINIQTRRRILA